MQMPGPPWRSSPCVPGWGEAWRKLEMRFENAPEPETVAPGAPRPGLKLRLLRGETLSHHPSPSLSSPHPHHSADLEPIVIQGKGAMGGWRAWLQALPLASFQFPLLH